MGVVKKLSQQNWLWRPSCLSEISENQYQTKAIDTVYIYTNFGDDIYVTFPLNNRTRWAVDASRHAGTQMKTICRPSGGHNESMYATSIYHNVRRMYHLIRWQLILEFFHLTLSVVDDVLSRVNYFYSFLNNSKHKTVNYCQIPFHNKATRSPEISREQVQKLTPQFLLYIYWI